MYTSKIFYLIENNNNIKKKIYIYIYIINKNLITNFFFFQKLNQNLNYKFIIIFINFVFEIFKLY